MQDGCCITANLGDKLCRSGRGYRGRGLLGKRPGEVPRDSGTLRVSMVSLTLLMPAVVQGEVATPCAEVHVLRVMLSTYKLGKGVGLLVDGKFLWGNTMG